MFNARATIEGLLASCPIIKFAPGKRDYFAGQTAATAAGNVLHQGIGTLAIGALSANTAGTVVINDQTITPISLIDAWVAEGTTIPNALTRGRLALTIRNVQATPGGGVAAAAASSTTVINLPATYAPVASALVGLELYALTGANAGTHRTISANTTGAITVAAFGFTPATGDIFQVAGCTIDVTNLASATATLSTDYVLQFCVYN